MFIFSGKAKRFSLQSLPRPTFVGRGLISGLLEKVRTFYQQNPDVGGQKFLPPDPLSKNFARSFLASLKFFQIFGRPIWIDGQGLNFIHRQMLISQYL